jgi:hypothetical protein
MEIGDLVKNRHNGKVGIIMGYVKTHRCVGTLYGVFIEGKMFAQHETDLEVL